MRYHELLLIDYHFVRLNINSLALQAVAQRVRAAQSLPVGSELEKTSDYAFIREVVDGSTQILTMVTRLADDDKLKYIPSRLYIRFASAAVYLLNVSSYRSKTVLRLSRVQK